MQHHKFDRRRCKTFSRDWSEDNGFASNTLHYQDVEGGVAAFVELRPGRRGDFALSEVAINYLLECLQEGVFVGAYVIIVDRNGQVIMQMPADELAERLDDVEPEEGNGNYWWINRSMEPVDNEVNVMGAEMLAKVQAI